VTSFLFGHGVSKLNKPLTFSRLRFCFCFAKS